MKDTSLDVIIIGAGLTGLALAHLLHERKIPFTILEARERVGGRILTKKTAHTTHQEMGATWFGKQHSYLSAFLEKFKLDPFEQVMGQQAIYEPISTSQFQLVELPPNNDPSFRIAGGSNRLIDALVQTIPSENLHLGQQVVSIDATKDIVEIKTTKGTFKAATVVSTLPPYLFGKSIEVRPTLPAALLNIAELTHTWMGESIKVSLAYEKPFWRAKGKSGTIFSNVGPIPEMYDHSNVEDNQFALKGFLNGSYFSATKEERLAAILKQLHKYFGAIVHDFMTYEEVVWREEPYTFSPYTTPMIPHRNNGHAVYKEAYLEDKLWVAGSETASHFPGYMEGAIRSAVFIHDKITSIN